MEGEETIVGGRAKILRRKREGAMERFNEFRSIHCSVEGRGCSLKERKTERGENGEKVKDQVKDR